jgi:nicotinate-nucleotide--dimethylbenzimidazole phosphoribosyltransferase
MPSFRLYPLLVAGVAGLTLAACGGDDDPPAQAGVPAQTESAPAQTAPAQTPTTTAPDAATPDDATNGDSGATPPADAGGDSPDTASRPENDGDAGAQDSPPAEPADKSSGGKGSGSSSRSDSDSGSGGSEQAKVRASLIALQEAFAAKNGKKACSYMIGVPQKTDPKQPGISCEALSQGPKAELSEENRKAAAAAKVTINGNQATAELGPGMPMTLRKVDGRWRVDYSQMGGGPAPGSR